MAKLTKVCPGCKRLIPVENFRGEMCAACSAGQQRLRGTITVRDTKVCSRCRRTLPRSAFSTNMSRHDGLSAYCRDCDREKHRMRCEEKRARENGSMQPSPAERPATKQCVKCGRELPLSAFPVRPELRSGYDSRCKECFNEACRASKEARKKAEEYKAEKAARALALPPVPPKINPSGLPKLAPCPFCGKKPKLKRLVVVSMVSWEIECDCTADPSRYVTFSFETPDEAGAFWNRRPGVQE